MTMRSVKQIMAPPFTVTAPVPPRSVSPNARLHPLKLHSARKRYRAACMAHFMGQGLRRFSDATGELSVRITLVPKVRRNRDDDNLIASCKALFDGLSAVIGVNDSAFRVQAPIIADPDSKNPRIIISVEKA